MMLMPTEMELRLCVLRLERDGFVATAQALREVIAVVNKEHDPLPVDQFRSAPFVNGR